mmetsp:Transcript_11087/g.39180  ORF Transcript_11087/g.39180 Transcript_11087/m.39180 type:complete len:209 (-) Transcript_11087:31-657(-)
MKATPLKLPFSSRMNTKSSITPHCSNKDRKCASSAEKAMPPTKILRSFLASAQEPPPPPPPPSLQPGALLDVQDSSAACCFLADAEGASTALSPSAGESFFLFLAFGGAVCSGSTSLPFRFFFIGGAGTSFLPSGLRFLTFFAFFPPATSACTTADSAATDDAVLAFLFLLRGFCFASGSASEGQTTGSCDLLSFFLSLFFMATMTIP